MKPLALDAGLATGFAATERAGARRESGNGSGSGFAGLLDGERQRLDARAEKRSDERNGMRNEARNGARPTADAATRNAEAAQAERRQLEARRAQAQERDERPDSADRLPAQAKPGAEPTPQRAALPTAKRPESTARAQAAGEDGATAAATATSAEAAASTGSAEAGELDPSTEAAVEPAPSRTAPAVEPSASNGAWRWSSTLALQQRPDADGASAAGDAALPASPRGLAAVGARAAEEAATPHVGDEAGRLPAAIDVLHADPAHDAAAAARDTTAAIGPTAARIDAPPAALAAIGAAPPSTSAPTLAAPAQASLPAPIESPAFGPQLGFQLASFVQDGVQQAQLQLNPAEMGPVAVRIVLDGNQAQIDFAAAHQRTREVIEAHWPALAAALHGAGFTLGGGGVSEQRSQDDDAQGEPGEGAGRRGARGVGGLETGDVAAVRVAIDGKRALLDLYA